MDTQKVQLHHIRKLSSFSTCWTQFLKDILRLPAAVGERQTFNLNNDSGTESIFDPEAKVVRLIGT